ncbi:MAG: glycogen/starch/alpha-glucan phosphorylase, partial [Puniceicoccales bacterium]
MPATKKKRAAKKTAAKKSNASTFAIDSSVELFKKRIEENLIHTLARDASTAKPRDWWLATCHALNDRILERYIATQGVHNKNNVRRVYYLSLEYLMGRLTENNLVNCGMFEIAEQALKELGMDLRSIEQEELDMGLGNGGLGRLAACFLDSLATLDYPAIGYGIHYEFGLFRQEFVDGHQMERPDAWMRHGNPWHIVRPEYEVRVPIYGHVEYKNNS